MMGLLHQYESHVEHFIAICHRLAAKGYVTSQGGNLAWRVAEDVILITATRLPKGEHQPRDVVFVDACGRRLAGDREPTGELPIYLTFFHERPDVRSVVHCHPPCCSALAISAADNPLMRPLYPEVVLEIGPVPLVPYATPLTQDLADKFKPLLPKYNAFLMQNHGVIMVSPRDLDWTAGLVEELESTADSALRALAVGNIQEIPRAALVEMDRIMTIRNLPRCGAPGVNPSLESLYYPEKME
jgi:L-fuculose-phosphate aldolase